MTDLTDPKATLRDLFAWILVEIQVGRALDTVRDRIEDLHPRGEVRGERPIRLISMGKAAVSMTEWWVAAMGDRGFEGIVSAPDCRGKAWPGIRCFEGGHPSPNRESLRAGRAALEIARTASEEDRMVYLISGGGSTLLESPIDEGVSLEDLRYLNRTIVSCGAGIEEVNVVRKHLSAVKGGRLAVAAHPARQLTLYVSDVPDGRESSVASGPTMPDESTLEDLHAVVRKYDLHSELPTALQSLLDSPSIPETPKPEDHRFAASEWICVLGNAHALDAARRFTEERGWETIVDNTVDEIDVGEAAARLVERLRQLRSAGRGNPVCLLSGGELSSPVRGGGVGGRNQAFVLECVECIAGERIAVLSAGTDGVDGNSPAAGAVADGLTRDRARSLQMEAADYLARSDAHSYFARLGDAIVTGPTRNNVRDVRVLVSWP